MELFANEKRQGDGLGVDVVVLLARHRLLAVIHPKPKQDAAQPAAQRVQLKPDGRGFAPRPSTLACPSMPTAPLTYLSTSAMSTRLNCETHRAVRPRSDALVRADRIQPPPCPYAHA
eukprot:6212472-Pleurochrysis_carterae.AAC.2